MNIRLKRQLFLTLLSMTILQGCTTGQLNIVDSAGQQREICQVEYSWQPSVDKYAVEYVLAYCARMAKAKGHQVLDDYYLTLDTPVVRPPNGQTWTFELATLWYKENRLTDKEYGYLVAFIDLNGEE